MHQWCVFRDRGNHVTVTPSIVSLCNGVFRLKKICQRECIKVRRGVRGSLWVPSGFRAGTALLGTRANAKVRGLNNLEIVAERVKI